jgi:hypothetical protein
MSTLNYPLLKRRNFSGIVREFRRNQFIFTRKNTGNMKVSSIPTVILGVGRPADGHSRWWAAHSSPRTAPDGNSYMLIHSHSSPTVKKTHLTKWRCTPVPPWRPRSAVRSHRLRDRTLHGASLSTAPSLRQPASIPR